MKICHWKQRRFCAGLIILVLCTAVVFTSCSSGEADAVKIVDAYIDGFTKLYEQGNEYTDLGLQLQADYAYSWAAASTSAMRYCVDCLLHLKGEGQSSEKLVASRLSEWDKIASMNYVSPYPWYFEGLVYNMQKNNDAAQVCYEMALLNPAFSAEHDEALSVLLTMSVKDLEAIRAKLSKLEDKIFTVYEPKQTTYPREELGFSDTYLRARARECLVANPDDYRGALRHYEEALRVNPFEGDNFAGCALMHLYLNETDNAFFYVNEGLFVDPEHEGLNKMADILNGEA